MKIVFFVIFIFFTLKTEINGTDEGENVKINYEKLYTAGIDAYLQNRWDDCISLIEKSLEDYFYYNTIISKCRLKCQTFDKMKFHNVTDKAFDVWYFQTLVTEISLCLMRCQNTYFHNRPKVSKETDADFLSKAPYNYLQLCYFKVLEPEKAASCAYTFLVHNPSHQVMRTNLKYYMAVPGIDVNRVKYLEMKDYQELFLKGAQLYTSGHHKSAIDAMEMSLKEYLAAEDSCRAQCEGPMPEGASEELYLSVANHFTFSLRCKLRCPEQLAFMYGQKYDGLFANHFHYLQFLYFKVGDLKRACSAVSSFLLFNPDDETMLSNREFYLKQPNVPEKWFIPRKVALEYHRRMTRELGLISAIDSNFQFSKTNQSAALVPPPGLKKGVSERRLGKRREPPSGWFESAKVLQHMDEKQLNGTGRAAFLNLATPEECLLLMNLAKEGGVHGDGYNGKTSPHTEFEMFEGLTVARAAILASRSIVNASAVSLFLSVSEKARQAVEAHFRLETELFFSYTHLVCRTALGDSPDARHDFSHPIHADNCILTPAGKCLKEKPAYTWRDYSSIVYLNGDFEGGEFVFATEKNNVQASLTPSCGKMTAFSAGAENPHGVRAVRKGRRCALAAWYTLDPDYRERERDFADSLVGDLMGKRKTALPHENAVAMATLLRFSETDHHHESPKHDHSEL